MPRKKATKEVEAPTKTKRKSTKEEEEEEDPVEDEAKTKKAKKEETSSDSVKTDFSQPQKGVNELKIASWNVAGWNSITGKGFDEYVKQENPDIICVQETKIDPSKVKTLPGYFHHFYAAEKAGYSGTGIFSAVKPISWTDGIGIADHDTEGRVITAEYDKFYLVNTYIPNSGRGLKDLDYRKKWDKDFLEYLKKLDAKKPVIWCGDLNVARDEIDLKNPKQNRNKTAGFSDEEREGFTNVLKAGFVDTFRHLHPNEEGAYTFWSYFKNARGNNIGWRLDYFVISQRILDKMGNSYRRPHIMGSDHCPIVLHIALKDDAK